MKRVRPRSGIILAGIPKSGAEIPDKLAKEWLDNGLVVEIGEDGNPIDQPKEPEPEKPRRGRPPKEAK